MSSGRPADSGDPRIGLAQNRTSMANLRTQLALDRTTLAWIRTTLTMASFGFGMVAFFRTLRETSPSAETLRLHRGAIGFGLALIALGLCATTFAAASHWLTLRKLARGEEITLRQWPLSLWVAMLLAGVCLAGLVALVLM